MNSKFFTDTITVLRYYSSLSTRGTGGQLVKTYSTYMDVVGSFQNAGASWNVVSNVEAFRKTKTFYCNVVDIRDVDRVEYNDKNYDVINVSNIAEHHLEINLQIRSTGST